VKQKFGWRNIDIDSRGQSIGYFEGDRIYQRSLDASGIGPEKLIGMHEAVTDIRFRPDGNEIASSDHHGEIRLWSLVPGLTNPVRVIAGNGPGNRIWFDPTGRFLLAPGGGGLLRWDLSVPESEPMAFRYQEEEPRAVTFDQEGRRMAVAGQSTIAFYPLIHSYPHIFRGSKFGGHVRFLPGSKSLVNGYEAIQMWSVFGEKETAPRTLWTSGPSIAGAESMDVDPLGKFVLIGTSGEGVHLISIGDGKDLRLKSNPPFNDYQGVALSNDGKFAAASRTGKDPGIEIWDLRSGGSRLLKQSIGLWFYSLRFSSDVDSLFSGADGNLYQWNLKDDSHKVFHLGNHWVTSIAITKDGRYVAASSSSANNIFELAAATSELVLYDLKQGSSTSISSHGNRVWSVTFDPSDTKLLTGDLDGIVRVGPISGEDPQLLLGHGGGIGTVLVSPDGKWILSSDSKSTLQLWPMPVDNALSDLPYDEMVNRLRDLTNVRAMADKNSPNGYHIQYGAFAGWNKTPNW
jgi:WD40 repeat protein